MSGRPIGALISRKIGEIDRKYAAVLASGFPTADFEGQPEPETLQCRHELDRTNWIGLLLQCQAMAALGLGEELIPEPGMRCTSNRMYRPTFDGAQARLWVLFAQAAAAQANWWRLKDAARAAADWRELERLDLDEGWP